MVWAWGDSWRYEFCSLTYFTMLGDGTGVDLEDVQTCLFIGQFNVWRTEEEMMCPVRQLTRVLKKNKSKQRRSYGFFCPACQAAEGLGPECQVCWWPWSSWLCAACQSHPSGSAADRTHRKVCVWTVTQFLSRLSQCRAERTWSGLRRGPCRLKAVFWPLRVPVSQNVGNLYKKEIVMWRYTHL